MPSVTRKFLLCAISIGPLGMACRDSSSNLRNDPGQSGLFREIDSDPNSFPYFMVNVELPGGERHRFVLDTGWVGESTISKKLAKKLRLSGNDIKCKLLLKDGTKLAFTAFPSDELSTVNGQVTDGTVGLGLLADCQLEVDYNRYQVWCRASRTPLSRSEAANALTEPGKSPVSPSQVQTVPLTASPGGWFLVDMTLNGAPHQGSVDTGATALYVSPEIVDRLRLPKVVDIKVTTPYGLEQDGVFVVDSVTAAGVPFVWPVVRSSINEPDSGITLGASFLPSSRTIIDFPGKRLFFRKLSEGERINSGVRQYFNRHMGIFDGVLRMDWSQPSEDRPGLESAPVMRVQSLSSETWVSKFQALARGDRTALRDLIPPFQETFTHERLRLRLNGEELDFPF